MKKASSTEKLGLQEIGEIRTLLIKYTEKEWSFSVTDSLFRTWVSKGRIDSLNVNGALIKLVDLIEEEQEELRQALERVHDWLGNHERGRFGDIIIYLNEHPSHFDVTDEEICALKNDKEKLRSITEHYNKSLEYMAHDDAMFQAIGEVIYNDEG